jgi:hypothetical protein
MPIFSAPTRQQQPPPLGPPCACRDPQAAVRLQPEHQQQRQEHWTQRLPFPRMRPALAGKNERHTRFARVGFHFFLILPSQLVESLNLGDRWDLARFLQ